MNANNQAMLNYLRASPSKKRNESTQPSELDSPFAYISDSASEEYSNGEMIIASIYDASGSRSDIDRQLTTEKEFSTCSFLGKAIDSDDVLDDKTKDKILFQRIMRKKSKSESVISAKVNLAEAFKPDKLGIDRSDNHVHLDDDILIDNPSNWWISEQYYEA